MTSSAKYQKIFNVIAKDKTSILKRHYGFIMTPSLENI